MTGCPLFGSVCGIERLARDRLSASTVQHGIVIGQGAAPSLARLRTQELSRMCRVTRIKRAEVSIPQRETIARRRVSARALYTVVSAVPAFTSSWLR